MSKSSAKKASCPSRWRGKSIAILALSMAGSVGAGAGWVASRGSQTFSFIDVSPEMLVRSNESVLDRSEPIISLPLDSSETYLDMGVVPQGGRKQCDFWLSNAGDHAMEVTEIETSCDCLTIELPNRIFPPGQKVAGHALLDLRREPHFKGKLGIDVRGKGKLGQVVFTMVINVAVDSEQR